LLSRASFHFTTRIQTDFARKTRSGGIDPPDHVAA
jgi:hypothetical protein